MADSEQELSIHVIRKGDLRSGSNPYAAWKDPDGLAPLSQQKIQMMLSNFLSRDEQDPVQLVGTLGEEVIGRIDLLPGEVVAHGNAVPVLWGSNLFVPQKHRHTGLGLMLMFRMQAMHHTIAVCGISQIIYPIYQKLRWVDFEMKRFILLRRSRSVLERYAGAGLHSRALAVAANVALGAQWGALRAMNRLRSGSQRVMRLDSAPPDWDERLNQETRAIAWCHRSAAWLNWLLNNRNNDDARSRQALYSIMNRAGKPLGYFLVKVRFYESATQRNFRDLLLGSLSDWMIFEPDRLSWAQLVLHAIGVMSAMKVDAMEVCVPDQESGGRLSRMGFVPAGSLRMLFKPSPKSPLNAKQFHDQNAWRIRPAEGDHFFT